jgi:ketosteroid isomerase-like protein
MTACTTPPRVSADTLAREREALLRADREFSTMSVEKGAVAAFAHFFAEDAVALPASAPPLHGRDAIVKAMSAGPPESLVWSPLDSGVSAAGDLGYTFGTYESRERGADGKPRVAAGKYTSIWRKQRDGTWKIVLDIGNQTPEAPAP